MQRPVGVTIIAVFQFLIASVLILVSVASALGLGLLGTIMARVHETGAPGLVGLAGAGATIAGILFGFAALFGALGYGMWTLRNWARIATIVLAALGALGAGLGFFWALVHFRVFALAATSIRVGINLLILWYLNQRHVWTAFRLRTAVLLAIVILLLVQGNSSPAFGQPSETSVRTGCKASAHIDVAILKNAEPGIGAEALIGREIAFNALNAKVVTVTPASSDGKETCETTYHPIFDIAVDKPFQWTLETPVGSSATLSATDSLVPRLIPDKAGEYRVKFIACPAQPCRLAQPAINIPRLEQTVAVQVVGEFALPPSAEPFLPELTPTAFNNDFSEREAAEKCDGSLGPDAWYAPQLVTVNRWSGPTDYERLEGKVRTAEISRRDNDVNHDDNDFGFNVTPDPPFRKLNRNADADRDMHVEWEWSRFPDQHRPTRGDRVSVFGYWVLDCHHRDPAIKTEIHPPVIVVSHRERAVRLPESLGTNVYVPGIVSDIWVNRDGGQMTDGCRASGLHQPSHEECLPRTVTSEDKNPIRGKIYEFNIYLPPNPRQVYKDAGLTAPHLPIGLYSAVLDRQTGESLQNDRLRIRPSQDGSHLVATLDLRNFSGNAFARRIVAAWEYPSPKNWGLRRWKLRINSLRIENDSDGEGSGEWRLWFNTNSTDQEWTLHDFDASEGHYDFDGIPYETGSPDPRRWLGPDLLLFPFPEQNIWIHAGGYEQDQSIEDSTGDVYDTVSQAQAQAALTGQMDYCPDDKSSFCLTSLCSSDGRSGCGRFNLQYDIVDGSEVLPVLSDEGRRIYDAYLIKVGHLAPPQGPVKPVRPDKWNHPSGLILTQSDKPVTLTTSGFFPVAEPEPLSLEGMTTDQFLKGLERTRQKHPDRVERVMKELREELLAVSQSTRVEDQRDYFARLKQSIPRDLWDRYFADVAAPVGQQDVDSLRQLVSWLVVIVILQSIGIAVLLRRYLRTRTIHAPTSIQ